MRGYGMVVPVALGVTWAPATALDHLVPTVLPRAEIADALHIADPGARAVRLAGRALLVAVLARELGVAPVELPRLTRSCQHCGGPHGPPRLPGARVTASLSRADGVVAVGWARTPGAVPAPAVGLDVVDPDRPPPDPAAVLHPRERARGLDGHARTVGSEHLRRAWARKEAVLKVSGHGLAVDPASLDLGPGRAQGPDGTLVGWTRVPAGGWRGAHVTDLRVGPVPGALAVDRGWSPPARVDVRPWEA